MNTNDMKQMKADDREEVVNTGCSIVMMLGFMLVAIVFILNQVV